MLMEPLDAWLATLGQLQLQLHQATYETWVRDAQFVAYEDGIFTIGVKNDYAKDWLEKRLSRMLHRTLAAIVQEDIQIQFIIKAPEPPADQSFGPLLDWHQARARLTGEAPAPASITAPPREKSPPVRFAQGEHLNSDFLLEDFVVGGCNGMAHAAAMMLIDSNPASRNYNPLCVYGGVGLGKTHLLHGIGNAFLAGGLDVLYVSAETFTNDLIRAIRTQQTEAFRTHYRNVDVLIVDDIQFIAGKQGTQEEFFHTFNALHNQNRQIVLAADRVPRLIDDLDERLRSRFEGGLNVELRRPDFETRMCILKKKAIAQDMELPDRVAEQIANQPYNSIRDMEGLLNQVLAKVALTRQPLTVESVAVILQDHGPIDGQKSEIDLTDILETTARYHQLTLDDLLGKQRSQEVALARHIAIYLAREEIKATLPAIGRALGGRSHSTILNSYRKVVELMNTDPVFRRDLIALRDTLYK